MSLEIRIVLYEGFQGNQEEIPQWELGYPLNRDATEKSSRTIQRICFKKSLCFIILKFSYCLSILLLFSYSFSKLLIVWEFLYVHIMQFNQTYFFPSFQLLIYPPHHFSPRLHMPVDTAFYWLPWVPYYQLIVERIYIVFNYHSFCLLLSSVSFIIEVICKKCLGFIRQIISVWSNMSSMILSPVIVPSDCVPWTPSDTLALGCWGNLGMCLRN